MAAEERSQQWVDIQLNTFANWMNQQVLPKFDPRSCLNMVSPLRRPTSDCPSLFPYSSQNIVFRDS